VSTIRRWPVVILFTTVLFAFGLNIGSPTVVAVGSLAQSTLQPTETVSPLTTATPLPSSTPAAMPSVNWADVNVHKQAMKSGFEGDVDKVAPTANRYLIIANLQFETDAIIRGSERVRYTNRSTDILKEIVFRLYVNTPVLAGRMNITHIRLNGQSVEGRLSGLDSVLTVPLDKLLAPGDAVEMIIDFDVTMPRGMDVSYGRFGYVHDVVSATAWYPTLSVYDKDQGWWKAIPNPQGDPAYTEVGLYDVRLTMPADQTVAMSGKEIETTKNADGTVTHRDVTGPMRDYAFQASKRYTISPIDVDGTQVNIVHYKDESSQPSDATAKVTKYARQSVPTYTQTYGDYPYKELDVVENPTPTGVEFPGLVQISERAWGTGNDFLEIIVCHEVAHQWFYALIGNDQVGHPWLDEGLARYSEFVYMRANYPPTVADNYVNGYQKSYDTYRGKGLEDLPVDRPVSSFSPLAYGVIVYGKGALFIVELERQLGRDTVYRTLREYFKRYKYAVVTSQDIEQTFEDVSGKNLDELFRKWIGAIASADTPTPTSTAIM
jgi:hypothetical protein